MTSKRRGSTCQIPVIPRQVIKRSHAKTGDDRSLPLLGQQLLPHTFLGSQWLLYLMGVELVGVETMWLHNKLSTR